jgi:predicted nucleic acid-binding protein
VVDASVVVALLTDAGPAGRWAAALLRGPELVAPGHMPFEVANALRRGALQGTFDWATSGERYRRLNNLAVGLIPLAVISARTWELAPNLSIYDVAYVALAELLDAPLVTLDKRLARAPGIRCEVVTYEGL